MYYDPKLSSHRRIYGAHQTRAHENEYICGKNTFGLRSLKINKQIVEGNMKSIREIRIHVGNGTEPQSKIEWNTAIGITQIE